MKRELGNQLRQKLPPRHIRTQKLLPDIRDVWFESNRSFCDHSRRPDCIPTCDVPELFPMNTQRAAAQLLSYLASIGVTHLPRVVLPKQEPRLKGTRRTAAPAPAERESRENVSRAAAADRPASSAAPGSSRAPFSRIAPIALAATDVNSPPTQSDSLQILNQTFTRQSPGELTAKTDSLCQLAGIVAKCTRCTELAHGRTQTVFGVGNPNARIMLIGEAPGADEDAKGEPFVGAAGQLLNKIIQACQLKREELYICNILRCRPPGNRNPLPQEAVNCREFLDAQIHVVQPEFIICLGTVAAQNLLGVTKTIGKLRGEFHDHKGISVMCTYHPSYLLRYPAAKTQVWDDMKWFMKHLGVELR